MTTKALIITAALLLSTGIASAQTTQVDSDSIGTGLISPDSALYPLQIGFDNIANSPAENAVKRANEARQASEQDNSEAADRALAQVSDQADSTEGTESDNAHLSEAQLVINEIDANTHSEQGLDTASQRIEAAKNSQPADTEQNTVDSMRDLADQAREGAEDVSGNRP